MENLTLGESFYLADENEAWNGGNSLFYRCPKLTSLTGLKLKQTYDNVKTINKMFIRCDALTEISFTEYEGGTTFQNLTSVANMFTNNTVKPGTFFSDESGLRNLTTVHMNGWNTPKLTSMASMFSGRSDDYEWTGCERLTTVEMNNWGNLKELTNVSRMFSGCESLKSEAKRS